MFTCFNNEIYRFLTNIDILKTKGKLEIMKDNTEENNEMHTMISRNRNSMQ